MQVTRAMERAAGLGGAELRQPEATGLGWEGIAGRVARGAGGLLEEIGPAPVVAILAENSLDYLVALLAVIRAGGRAVPLNHRLGEAEIEELLSRTAPALLLVDGANARRAAGWHGRRMRLDAASGWAMLESAPPVAPREVDEGSPVLTLFTGGTTGLPRGVDLSAAALLGNARIGAGALSLAPGDMCCFTAPFFHIGGLALAFCAMVAGAGGVVVPRFDPLGTPEAIAAHRATLVFLTPTMMGMVLDAPGADPARMRGLTRIFYGASPISPALLRRIDAAWPGVDLIQAYGQTEICPLAILPAEDHRRALSGEDEAGLGAAGYPTPGHELRIVDGQGRDCPQGVPGEVWARGPTAMLGYRGDEAATAAARGPNGYIRTGDVGFLDTRGRLHLVDRLKDMIVTGGENVYSTEVENALAAHPAVARVAVIGLPDPRWGERVHAVVELRPGHPPGPELEAELAAFARSRLGGFKCPRSIAFSAGPLPLTGAGKVAKAELRKAAWQGEERRIG